jgi:hypothetical protein
MSIISGSAVRYLGAEVIAQNYWHCTVKEFGAIILTVKNCLNNLPRSVERAAAGTAARVSAAATHGDDVAYPVIVKGTARILRAKKKVVEWVWSHSAASTWSKYEAESAIAEPS